MRRQCLRHATWRHRPYFLCEDGQIVPVIALDADGVLLNYHAAYRQAWERAFGYLPESRDSMAYWPIDRWDVRHLEGVELDQFRASFDQDFWASIPAIPGAVSAC